MVTEEDFMEAHKELVPSVSADELRHYDRVRKQFEGAGKKEDKKENGTGAAPAVQQVSDAKGKGKGKAPVDEVEDMVVRTENLEVNGFANGDANGSAGGSGSGKGKGKAPANHTPGKSSVDIAEGGFGDATMDDDLYS